MLIDMRPVEVEDRAKRARPENAVLLAVWNRQRTQLMRRIQLAPHSDVLTVYGPPDQALVALAHDHPPVGRLRYAHSESAPTVRIDEVPRGGFRDADTGMAIDAGHVMRNNTWITWSGDPEGRLIEVVFK